MEKMDSMYVKLKSHNPFLSYYSYVDKPGEIGRAFRIDRVPVKIKDVFVPDSGASSLAIVVLSVRKKHEKALIESFEHHKRNSILFGWGQGQFFEKVVSDLHVCADF
ncbi:MAG: hypothetical protein IKQ97_07195 [Eubacterium sp.]|nr:hypothetical protein [Eubacterium sp.]